MRRMKIGWMSGMLLAGALVLVAAPSCGDDDDDDSSALSASDQCREDFPVETPDALRDQATCFSEEDGGDPDDAFDPERLAAECEAEGGAGCDVDGWLSADAARCVAEASGLGGDSSAYEIWKVYDHGFHVVAWNVARVTNGDACGCEGSADTIKIDATTGEVLDTGDLSWLC
ncbi:MAG: hypothetical protein H6684_11475 [Deltaproteobacteria bacterium]|nr:hypothetical protein [Deltaproteobacteria bacterium]MCB9478359.1 hypothetical protein [Deltaproteobacteria bacterium]MCB9489343.1 hypothetical protein [Deltaproteobacteria bacterium]